MIEAHWIDFYVNGNNIIYSDIFGIKYIPKNKKIKKKHIKTNIYRVQAFDSIMCGYFCIEFIDFMFKDKSVLDYIDLFSPDDYEKNDKMVLKCFQLFSTKKMKMLYCAICDKYRKFEKPKIST